MAAGRAAGIERPDIVAATSLSRDHAVIKYQPDGEEAELTPGCLTLSTASVMRW
jgi:hypothetical protein